MKLSTFFAIGLLFGIIMIKSEAVSWFRIQEMFRFQSFHMYGIIGTAVIAGALLIFISKKMKWKTIEGKLPDFAPRKMEIPRLLFGGILFGLGWAMTGACPGPLYALLGYGVGVVIVVLIAGLFGAYVHGMVREQKMKTRN